MITPEGGFHRLPVHYKTILFQIVQNLEVSLFKKY